jgi:hypothetical protein
MTFSGRAYEEPCFATPLHATKPGSIFKTRGLDRSLYECVNKTETKGIRWRFLYGSARDQLELNEEKHQSIRQIVANVKQVAVEEEDSEEDSDESSDEDSSDDDLSDKEGDGKCED